MAQVLIEQSACDLNNILLSFCRFGFDPQLLSSSLWPRILPAAKSHEINQNKRLYVSLASRISRSGRPVKSSQSQVLFWAVAKY